MTQQPAQKHSTTSSSIEARAVDPEQWWDIAAPHLKSACDSVGWLGDFDALRLRVVEGDVKLLCFYRGTEVLGFTTLEIDYTTARKVLYLEVMGGTTSELFSSKDVHRIVDGLAAFNACHSIVVGCRPGVSRLLRQKGWRMTAVIMEKQVNALEKAEGS